MHGRESKCEVDLLVCGAISCRTLCHTARRRHLYPCTVAAPEKELSAARQEEDISYPCTVAAPGKELCAAQQKEKTFFILALKLHLKKNFVPHSKKKTFCIFAL
jgi:hypothetical protein